MSQITYRGNLSAKAFPLVAEQFGRTVIVGGQDQNFNRQVVSAEDSDKDRGIPQVYYCHNVMPTAEGLQSVGYIDQYVAAPAVTDFKSIYTNAGLGGSTLLGHTATGDNYVNSLLTFHLWVKINAVPGDIGNKQITSCVLGGQTYYCFDGLGVWYYDNATALLTKLVLIGVVEADIRGITSSNGYLIAWTNTYVAWSSAVFHVLVGDPFDFTPSLVTGAGGGSIDMAKGGIVLCLTHFMGFVVYTARNAVGASYSGNARFPFNFKEITGAGGILDISLVSADADEGNHYAYTTSGLQRVGITISTTVMAEVSDFLSGKYFEDFDDATNTFTHETTAIRMNKGLNVIGDRYVVLSYGKFINDAATKFTHALIYDLGQKRFGKIKVDHEAVFAFSFEGISDSEYSDAIRNSIGIFHRTGLIKTIDFRPGSLTTSGTIVLGKYQYTRQRTITLDKIDLENVFPTSTFSVSNLLSVDGKNTVVMPVYANPIVGNLRSYSCRQTGINHSLLIKGNFYLTSLVLTFHMNGRR